MNEKIPEHERSEQQDQKLDKELNGLKKNIERGQNDKKQEKNKQQEKEIVTLHSEILDSAAKKEKQKQLEDIEKEAKKLSSSIDKKSSAKHAVSYENMPKEQIEIIAQQGREEAANKVISLIEESTLIPKRLKEKANA